VAATEEAVAPAHPSAIGVIAPATLLENVLMAMRVWSVVAEVAAIVCATDAMESATLPENVPNRTGGVTIAAAEAVIAVAAETTVVAAPNATNATDLAILLATVVKRRTGVTDVTVLDILLEIANKRRILATIATRSATS